MGWLILIPSGDAFGVFESMTERDLVSWNVMIPGYAFRGYNIDALLHIGKCSEELVCGLDEILSKQKVEKSRENPYARS